MPQTEWCFEVGGTLLQGKAPRIARRRTRIFVTGKCQLWQGLYFS